MASWRCLRRGEAEDPGPRWTLPLPSCRDLRCWRIGYYSAALNPSIAEHAAAGTMFAQVWQNITGLSRRAVCAKRLGSFMSTGPWRAPASADEASVAGARSGRTSYLSARQQVATQVSEASLEVVNLPAGVTGEPVVHPSSRSQPSHRGAGAHCLVQASPGAAAGPSLSPVAFLLTP